MNTIRRDPKGDVHSRHRRQDKKFYRDVDHGITMQDFKAGDILLVSSKSVIGTLIRQFSMVNGKAASVNHVGQVIKRKGHLCISEANFPTHDFTNLSSYLGAQRRGKCRLTLVRLKDECFKTETQKDHAMQWMTGWHTSQEGHKYTVAGLLPMAFVSVLRNLTPFIRNRLKGIPVPRPEDLFVCSAIVDWGWFVGQTMAEMDYFPSSLSDVPRPQDILDSPHVRFIAGWQRSQI